VKSPGDKRAEPLPFWVPEVYSLHEHIVDVEKHVALQSNCYSESLN
jgi:hypothetical protein